MWGLEAPVDLSTDPLTPRNVQLARVDYHRPESWRFLLWAQSPNFPGTDLVVRFSIFAGIGRTNFVQDIWQEFKFSNGGRKWTNTVRAPAPDDTAATDKPYLADTVVGQNVNISATVFTNGVATPLIVLVGAMLAPATHVRPDWFANVPSRFEGGQLGGK